MNNMVIEILMPEVNNKDKNVKDLVFSILTEGNSRTLTQLHREIKKRYGLIVSFQAVMKAVNSLIEKKVLLKEEKNYTISREWVFESRNFIDKLYRVYFNVNEPIKKVELGKEITVYTVTNLLELDRLWSDILTDWAKKETEEKINVWKGKHCWWLIPRLQEEDMLHDFFAQKKIQTYNLLNSDTLLDKISVKYYQEKKENVKISKKIKIEKDTHISAFGDKVLKFEIPQQLSEKLEVIYKKTKKIEDLNLKRVLDIFKENSLIEVTVIQDTFFANKIKEEVVSSFKK